jgi:hypothetical protein
MIYELCAILFLIFIYYLFNIRKQEILTVEAPIQRFENIVIFGN